MEGEINLMALHEDGDRSAKVGRRIPHSRTIRMMSVILMLVLDLCRPRGNG